MWQLVFIKTKTLHRANNKQLWILPPQFWKYKKFFQNQTKMFYNRPYSRGSSTDHLNTQIIWIPNPYIEIATPNKMLIYMHALLLHIIYDDTSTSPNWVDLNFQQYFNKRIQRFNGYHTSNNTDVCYSTVTCKSNFIEYLR